MLLSNHTGYGDFSGKALDGPGVTALVDGIARRGALDTCDAVLSGYLGSAGIGEAVLDAVCRTRVANPRALYACDPVIGDTAPGVYVGAGIVDLLRDRAVPVADLLTPNAFELATLTGQPVSTWTEAVMAAEALRARMRAGGPRALLVTSLETAQTPADAVDLLAIDDTGCVRVRVPRLPIAASGAGDLIAALFLLHFAATASAARAAERAAASVQGVLAATAEVGERELQLIAAQDELVRPTSRFEAEVP